MCAVMEYKINEEYIRKILLKQISEDKKATIRENNLALIAIISYFVFWFA